MKIKMKSPEKIWSRFQDNIVAIIFLSIFQIWLITMFPGHKGLGITGNFIIQIISGITGLAALLWLFVLNDKIDDVFFFDWGAKLKEPYKTASRWISTIIFIPFLAWLTYYFYRKGLFNYSKLFYIMMYADGILVYYFLYQASQRRKKLENL